MTKEQIAEIGKTFGKEDGLTKFLYHVAFCYLEIELFDHCEIYDLEGNHHGHGMVMQGSEHVWIRRQRFLKIYEGIGRIDKFLKQDHAGVDGTIEEITSK